MVYLLSGERVALPGPACGSLADRGTHQELLERGGLYRTLYEHQFNLEGRTVLATAG